MRFRFPPGEACAAIGIEDPDEPILAEMLDGEGN